jgi:hypothetical protein
MTSIAAVRALGDDATGLFGKQDFNHLVTGEHYVAKKCAGRLDVPPGDLSFTLYS